jgi:hypothetical protein
MVGSTRSHGLPTGCVGLTGGSSVFRSVVSQAAKANTRMAHPTIAIARRIFTPRARKIQPVCRRERTRAMEADLRAAAAVSQSAAVLESA